MSNVADVEIMSSLVDAERKSKVAEKEITDADIDKLIEDELNALNENDLDNETLQDDVCTDEEVNDIYSTSFSNYLTLVKNSTNKAEDVVIDTNDTMMKIDKVSFNIDDLLKAKLHDQLRYEDVQDLMMARDQTMKELEEEELAEEKELASQHDDPNLLAVDIIRPDVIEEIKHIEEQAAKELQELKEEHKVKEEQRRKSEERRKNQQNEYEEMLQIRRETKNDEIVALQLQFKRQQVILLANLQSELESKHLHYIEEEIEERINEIDLVVAKETERLSNLKGEQRNLKHERDFKSALVIQKHYKGYRVRRQYGSQLKQCKELRLQKQQETWEQEYEESQTRIQEEKMKQDKIMAKEKKEIEEKEKARLDRINKYNQQKLLLKQEIEQSKNIITYQNILTNISAESFLKKTELKKELSTEEKYLSHNNISGVTKEISNSTIELKNVEKETSQTDETSNQPNEELLITPNQLNEEPLLIKDVLNEDAKSLTEYKEIYDSCNAFGFTKSNIDVVVENTVALTEEVSANETKEPPSSPGKEVFNGSIERPMENKCGNTVRDKSTKVGIATNTVTSKVLNESKESSVGSKMIDSSKELSSVADGTFDAPKEFLNTIKTICNSEEIKVSSMIEGASNNAIKDVVITKEEEETSNNSIKDVSTAENKVANTEEISDPTNTETNAGKIETFEAKDVSNMPNHVSDKSVQNTIPLNENASTIDTVSTQHILMTEKLSSVSEVGSYLDCNNDTAIEIESAQHSNDEEIFEFLKELYEDWKVKNKGRKPAKLKEIKNKKSSSLKGKAVEISKEHKQELLRNKELSLLKVLKIQKIDEAFSIDFILACDNLQSLEITECGLQILDGKYLPATVEHIIIQSSSLQSFALELQNLTILNLNGNNLTSLNGLKHLPSLISLDVSNNNITRLNGVEQCINLLHLNVDNNQLLSVKCLGYLNQLVLLSCTNNLLSVIDCIHEMPYMTQLCLNGNNFTELPNFQCNVLLTEVHIDNNNLSTFNDMSLCWLPSLKILSMAGNSIVEVPELTNLYSLTRLDLSNNFLSDPSLLKSFKDCYSLKTLLLDGNAVHQCPEFNGEIENFIARNLSRDQKLLKHPMVNESSKFLLQYEDIWSSICTLIESSNANKDENNSIVDIGELIELWKRLHQICKNQLINYQQGDNLLAVKDTTTTTTNISNERSSKISTVVSEATPNVHKNSKVLIQSENIDSSITNNQTDKGSNNFEDNKIHANEIIIPNSINYHKVYHNHKPTDASIKSGYSDENLKVSIEEVVIDKNSFGSSCVNDDEMNSNDNNDIELTSEASKYEKEIASDTNVTHEDTEIVSSGSDSDFDYSEEINTDQFHFDESNFDWKISDTPNLPMASEAVLPNIVRVSPFHNKAKEAWNPPSIQNSPSQMSIPNLDLSSGDSNDQNYNDGESMTSSRKSESISNEWGFYNNSTTQLMMKRARKMGVGKRKKPMDAKERLDLFKKKIDFKTQVRTQKKEVERRSYFQDIASPEVESRGPINPMTYSWVCNQTVLHNDSAKELIADDMTSRTTRRLIKRHDSLPVVVLPPLNDRVLSGSPISLVQSEIHNPKPPHFPRSTSSTGRSKGRHSSEKKSHSAPNQRHRLRDPSKEHIKDDKVTEEKWKRYSYR